MAMNNSNDVNSLQSTKNTIKTNLTFTIFKRQNQ